MCRPAPGGKWYCASAAAGCTVLLLVWFAAEAGFGSVAWSGEPTGSPFEEAVAFAQPRTVKIFGAGIGRVKGFGTGVLVSADGHVLTAHGVYLSEGVQVVLGDGSRHPARVERSDPSLQLSLLKIEAATPRYFDLTEPAVARAGDWVLAVSNAFKVAEGEEPLSVTLGIISLRTRLETKRGTQDIEYDGDVLLIDCVTSNPGAAGGAVVDGRGRILGMIGRLFESKETNTRLNYAVPADLLARFLRNEPQPATVAAPTPTDQPGVVGVRLFGLTGGSRAPAYIDRVLADSPAARAGLRPDDLIVSVNGEVVKNIGDYRALERKLLAGKPAVFVVKRGQELLQMPLTPAAEENR